MNEKKDLRPTWLELFMMPLFIMFVLWLWGEIRIFFYELFSEIEEE